MKSNSVPPATNTRTYVYRMYGHTAIQLQNAAIARRRSVSLVSINICYMLCFNFDKRVVAALRDINNAVQTVVYAMT
jgi:hypothetical protein